MLSNLILVTKLLSISINQVAGYAVGGGHVLHMVCDLTIAADNAIFGQTGPKVLTYHLLCYFCNKAHKKCPAWLIVIFLLDSVAGPNCKVC